MAAPALGNATTRVLEGLLGLNGGDIAALRANGVVA